MLMVHIDLLGRTNIILLLKMASYLPRNSDQWKLSSTSYSMLIESYTLKVELHLYIYGIWIMASLDASLSRKVMKFHHLPLKMYPK
jgi:hypothetical protein